MATKINIPAGGAFPGGFVRVGVNGRITFVARGRDVFVEDDVLDALSSARVPYSLVPASVVPNGQIIIPSSAGFSGDLGVNGTVKRIPLDVAFVPAADVFEALGNARVPYSLVYTSGVAVTLGTLSLSGSLQIGVVASGSISGATSGSTITSNIPGITVNSGARTYSGTPTGSAATIANGLVEALTGATNTPNPSSVTVAAAAALTALSFSGSFQVGTAASGTITGAKAGSSIAGIPGITVTGSGTSRSYSGTPTDFGTQNFVETLAGATNSPRQTPVSVTDQATLRQVATRSYVPNTRSGGNTQIMSRTAHIATDAITSLQIMFPAWYGDTEAPATASITFTASIEYPGGVFTQVAWSASPTVTASAGADTGLSDAVAVSIPKDAVFWVRNYQTCTGGILTTQGTNSTRWSAQGEASIIGTSVADQTMSGTITQGGTEALMYPCAIVAVSAVPAFAGIGDSRTIGSTSSVSTGYLPDTNGNEGQLFTSLGRSYGFINMGNGGATLQTAVRNYSRRRALARAYTRVAVVGYGINDMRTAGSNRSSAQYLANLASMRALFHGMRYVESTIAPASSGTYTSAGGQTVDANASAVIAANTAIRAKPAPVSAVIDIASVLEDQANLGKWVSTGGVARTGDGIHANAQGYGDLVASGVVSGAILISGPVATAFSPPDISSLFAWFDLTDLGTNATGTTSMLSRTSAAFTAGTGILDATAFNGGPGFIMDGTQEQHTDSPTRAVLNGAPGLTVVGLFQLTAYPSTARTLQGSSTNSAANPRGMITVDATGKLGFSTRRLDADTTVSAVSASVTPTGTPVLGVAVFDPVAGVANLYVNGTLAATGNYASTGSFPATTPTSIIMGGTSALPVASVYREADFYASALTTTERQKVEGELLWRQGLQALLPGGHPYAGGPPTS